LVLRFVDVTGVFPDLEPLFLTFDPRLAPLAPPL
jgi:hypothetical protein